MLHLAHIPRITDVKAIIEEVKDYADLIWLENLNLPRAVQRRIMTYIREKYPDLIPPLYMRKFTIKRLEYWAGIGAGHFKLRAKEQGFPYRINDLPYGRSEGKPVIVNYFYHEKYD